MNEEFQQNTTRDSASPEPQNPVPPTPPASPVPPIPTAPVPPPAQPTYGAQPPYGAMPPTYPPVYPAQPQNKANGLAVASLVCGILSFATCCCSYLSALLGIAAIVLGACSRKGNEKLSGMAIAGLICGILGALLSIVLIVFMMVGGDTFLQEFENEFFQGFYDGFNDGFNEGFNEGYGNSLSSDFYSGCIASLFKKY